MEKRGLLWKPLTTKGNFRGVECASKDILVLVSQRLIDVTVFDCKLNYCTHYAVIRILTIKFSFLSSIR